LKNLTEPNCFLHRINGGLWLRVAETSGSATITSADLPSPPQVLWRAYEKEILAPPASNMH